MENIETGEEHLLIDGFPRTPEQVPTIDSVMEFFRREQPTIVYMQISDEEAVRRIMPRGRHDDTEEGIRQRLKWSKELTIPNIEWFRKNPKYKVIDVFGERPIEVVQQEIREKLGLL
jgi:adenylate kinase